jgi:hypothetical protein
MIKMTKFKASFMLVKAIKSVQVMPIYKASSCICKTVCKIVKCKIPTKYS